MLSLRRIARTLSSEGRAVLAFAAAALRRPADTGVRTREEDEEPDVAFEVVDPLTPEARAMRADLEPGFASRPSPASPVPEGPLVGSVEARVAEALARRGA